MTRKVLVCLFLIFALLGCTKSPDSSSGPAVRNGDLFCGDANNKVTRGHVCDDDNSSVVKIHMNNNSGQPYALCSGSLISQNAVLTASHCVDSGHASLDVFVGGKRFEDAGFVMHPRYNSQTASPYDVAIIFLSASATYPPPVPLLLRAAPQPEEILNVYGFGQDENEEIGTLKTGEMKFIGHDYNDMIVLEYYGASACFGDSGGPVVYDVDGFVGVIGVASAAVVRNGCLEDTMAIYANVQSDEILNFILEQVPNTSVL